MKRTNKYLSLALAIIMALSLCVTSFAEEGEETAAIEITTAVAGETYNAYKIFDYTANEAGNAYAYTINEKIGSEANPWFAVVQNYKVGDVAVFTLEATESNANIYNVKITDGEFTDADAKAFAAHLATQMAGKTPDDVAVDGKFENLGLGYYFIDTTVGSLCSLVNANTTQKIYEKNSIPTLTKEVQENADNSWGETAKAQIGEAVNFELTVNTGTDDWTDNETGVDDNYTIVDTIAKGMSFNNDFVVKVGDTVWEDGYTVDINATKDVATITLLKSKLATENTTIVITYSATLDEDANLDETVGNVNTAVLTYKKVRDEASATVYTYDFQLNKVDGQGKKLDGAEFKLYDKKTDAEIALIKVGEGADAYYRPVVAGETPATVIEVGTVMIKGLDEKEYYLVETKAPEGYNMLTEPRDVTPSNDAVVVTVENLAGGILPGTGGVGTTMFYVLGSVMMIGAAILLVTKKKMANEQ